MLILEAELLDHLIEPRVCMNCAPVGSLGERDLRRPRFPPSLEKLAKRRLRNSRGTAGQGAPGSGRNH